MTRTRTAKRRGIRYVEEKLRKMPPHIRGAVISVLQDLGRAPEVERVVTVDVRQLEGREAVTVNVLYELKDDSVHCFAGLLPLTDGPLVELFNDSYTAYITPYVAEIIQRLRDRGVNVKAAHKGLIV